MLVNQFKTIAPMHSQATRKPIMKKSMKLPVFAVTTLATVGAQASADYGPAIWNPAYSGHWYTSGYGHKFHVCHDMEGYYMSTISYFKQSGTSASVHYCVNGKKDASTDAPAGEVTQMVSEAYYAWHARCWNQHCTGTEHEGFANNPAWYTDLMYEASGDLSRHIADKFGWAKDRNHIIGHGQKTVSGWSAWASANLGIDPNCNTHTDPGPYWDWNHYILLVNNVLTGAIRDHYNALGGRTSGLGSPTTSEASCPDGVGRYNHFTGPASIYWTPNGGAWSIRGSIRDKWASMGWETSVLGYPRTDENTCPDGVGKYNHFFGNNGSIYWTPSTGAHEVHGAIHSKWEQLGWETGVCGYPTTDESTCPDNVGKYNHFSKNSSIYYTPSTGAHQVGGLIRDKWASLGWERSSLGYPTSDEYAVPEGRRSDFQGGTITYNASTGQTTIP